MERNNSKIIRNDETNVLKVLTEYAKNQGSKSPEKLYMVYTKLVYKILNIESGLRDKFNSSQLSLIATSEIMIRQTVLELMKKNIHYKLIYQSVKDKLQKFICLIAVEDVYKSNKEQYQLNLVS
ncbi:hypothetical protein [Arcobacter sp.]|uniref:hypothetical protein n=1 Tax=unclassified Arcobacter TaxID=2593671 RepID=UPI003AFFD101